MRMHMEIEKMALMNLDNIGFPPNKITAAFLSQTMEMSTALSGLMMGVCSVQVCPV